MPQQFPMGQFSGDLGNPPKSKENASRKRFDKGVFPNIFGRITSPYKLDSFVRDP